MNHNETKTPTNCMRCNDSFSLYTGAHAGIGYAVVCEPHAACVGVGCSCPPKSETYICYKCASDDEKERMRKTGVTTLYFMYNSPCNNIQHTNAGTNMTPSDYIVSDWSGRFLIRPMNVQRGKHNIARTRWDVWFEFEGRVWHGVQYGENTQLLHCKRTLAKVSKEEKAA